MEEKMKELTVLMSKTDRAMEITRNTQTEIENIKNNLMEEVRPMMVEKGKEEIAQKEIAKKEFDEMTKEAILRAKAEILQIRKQAEKEYQDKLIENVEKQKRIEDKLKSIERKEVDKEKISMARNAAEKALTMAKEEMKSYEDRHLLVIRPKLDEFETKIGDYAIELGIEELNKVGLEKNESEKGEGENEKTESAKAEEEKPEPVKPEEEKPEPVKPEEEKPESVKSEEGKAKSAKGEGSNPEPVKPEKRTTNPNAKIDSISFVFKLGVPQYKITTKNGQELVVPVTEKNQKLYEPATKQKKKEIDREAGFRGAHKIVDPFLLKFLKAYDKENGTSEYGRYVELLEDGYNDAFRDEVSDYDYIELSYDMNGKDMADMDKKNVKNLQKIARRNGSYAIAEYTKAKGIIARFIDRYLKTPKLPLKAKEAEKFSEPEKVSIENAYTHYMNESKTQGFDKVAFYKQLQRGGYTDEELKELRGKIEGEKGAAHRQFVENLSKDAQKPTEEPMKQFETEKSKSKGAKVFGGSEGKFSKPRKNVEEPEK